MPTGSWRRSLPVAAMALLAACAGGGAESDPALRLATGRQALARGELEAAVSDLAAAVVRHPEAATDLARAATAVGRQEQALAGLEAALELRPEDADLLFVAATLEMDVESLAAAEGHLRRALEQREDHLPARLQLARLLTTANRTAEALALLLAAEERTCAAARAAPPVAAARKPAGLFLQALGTVLLAHGELADARRRFEEAVELDPSDAEGHHGLGLALMALGESENAAEAFAAARQRDPGHLEATYQGLNLAERLGHDAEAGRLRERFEQLYRARLDRAGALAAAP